MNPQEQLLYYVEENNIDGIKALPWEEININTRDEFGQTVLHIAAKHGHMDVIKYLVNQKGADFMLLTTFMRQRFT